MSDSAEWRHSTRIRRAFRISTEARPTADGRSIFDYDRRGLIEEDDMKRSISLPIAQSSPTYIDPVCGMTVDPEKAAAEYDYDGTKFYFCAVRCKERFAADPDSFLVSREDEQSSVNASDALAELGQS